VAPLGQSILAILACGRCVANRIAVMHSSYFLDESAASPCRPKMPAELLV
jgi:hypothetical protein